MGSLTTPTILRGLLVPDPRFRWASYSSTLSTATQAGPLAGVPEAQVETEMVVEALGTQTASSQLRVKTIRGGHPGVDSARFVWKDETDSATHWRGWDPPVSISGFEFVDYSTTASAWKSPHAISLADDTVAVACMKGLRQIVTWLRNPDTGVWSEVEVYDFGSVQGLSSTPCLVELPSGRLLCFFWYELGSGDYQIRCYYTDDRATWTPAQKGCLPTAVAAATHVPNRFRVALLNGQLCMIMWLTESGTPVDQLYQYASNDLGATFDLVGSLPTTNRGWPDIIAHKGRILIAYITDSVSAAPTAVHHPVVRAIGSAYADFTAVEGVYGQADADTMEWATSPSALGVGDLSLWADDDGAVYLLGRDHTSLYELAARVSHDDGDTWEDLGGGPAAHAGTSTWRGLDASTYPRDFSVCANRGRAMVAHLHAANPGTGDDSLAAMWLGGYTTVCLPQESAGTTGPLTVAGWTNTWLPYDLPDNTGTVWARVSSGTATLAAGGLGLVTAIGQSEAITGSGAALTSTLAQGMIALAEVRVLTGTCYVAFQLSDATPLEYAVVCEVTPTAITFTDVATSALLGTVATTSAFSGYVQVLMALKGAKASLWYRAVGASGDREWTLVGSTAAVSTIAANSGNEIRWGQSASTTSLWRGVSFVAGPEVEQHLVDQDNFGDLLGRSWMPLPVYVDGGVSVQAIDGPTFRNDEWDISPRFTYGTENVFPDVSPSPRKPWRSLDDNADASIVWDIGDSVTYPMGSLVGVYLGDANFGTAALYGYTAGNAWVKIADLDLRAGTGLVWSRTDRMLRPGNSGSSLAHYLPTNILAGSHVKIAAGAGAVVRKIETNSAGTWTGGGSSLQTRILLESVTGTEDASGTVAELWSKDYTGVVPLTTAYKKLKLTIPAQDTAEGYFTIGAMNFGHVFPLGSYLMEYGWGRAVEWAYSTEQVEGRTGIRTVQAMGPTRRSVEVAWVDGVETSGLTDTSPNWVVGWAGGDPVAVPADIPWSLPGLLEHLEGATLPITYLAAFTPSASVVNITDRRLMLYGRVVSESIRADNVLGNEGATELIRVGTCRVESEE